MSGLCPGHSVSIITWTSDRSGIASRGVYFSAHKPHAKRKRTSKKIINLFLALYSITFSIIVFKKVSGIHGFKSAFSRVNVDYLSCSCINYGVVGYGQPFAEINFYLDVGKHLWLELVIIIWYLKPHLCGSCCTGER